MFSSKPFILAFTSGTFASAAATAAYSGNKQAAAILIGTAVTYGLGTIVYAA